MNRTVWIDGARVSLTPQALVGQGGEAEIYDLGDGRVVKWWKPPDHPDFAGLADAKAAAAHRLVERPAKLRALPGNLPAAVVVPCGFALAGKRSTDVVGYLMPRVAGTALHAYGEPRWRRDHPGIDVVKPLLALHDALAALHRAGIVAGDCNDLNVLVDGARVHLIDVDSYQLRGFPCAMFSERFVDPRLCDTQLVPVRPHDADSDWFAYAAMALRSLVWVGPWGGVHAPADPAKRCPPPARALRRTSVLGADIIYPRAARPLATVPDELVAALRAIFEDDRRGTFPRALVERLRFVTCSACGDEHARVRCPTCLAIAGQPPVVVHGRVRYQVIDLRTVFGGAARPASAGLAIASPADPQYAVGRATPIWFDAGALWRRGALGPDRIGAVLPGPVWVGARLGAGFYRAGGYAVGFVFRPDRGVLDDRVKLPPIRGQLVDAHATLGDDRAWLWLTCASPAHSRAGEASSFGAGRLVTTAIVVGADTSILAADPVDAPWLAGIHGACAVGPHLFVPTDDGIARVEIVQRTVVQTRTFAETAPLVSAGDRLVLAPGGLDAIRRRDAIRIQLT